MEEWVVPRRAPQVGLDLLQLRLPVAVDGHNDAIGEQAVEAEEGGHQMMAPQLTRRRRHTDSSLSGPTLILFCYCITTAAEFAACLPDHRRSTCRSLWWSANNARRISSRTVPPSLSSRLCQSPTHMRESKHQT